MTIITSTDKLAETTESYFKMLFACGGAMMISFFNGVVEAHSAVLLPRLQEPDSQIQVTKDQETWIASLGIFASPLSALLCGPFVDYLGRKLVIQSYFIVSALGYAIIAAATSVIHIYIGRILCSFGVGFQVAGIIYIAEVSTSQQRSLFMALGYSFFSAGILFTYAVGAMLPWNMGSATYALICILLFLYQWFTPESPAWLVKKGHIECAGIELKRLGRSDTATAEEIKTIQARCEEESNQKLNWRTLLQPTVWKPFLIVSILHFLEAATGVYNLLYYTVDFVQELGTQYDAFQVSTALAIGRLLMTTTLGSYFTTKVKRRPATAISAFTMGATLLVAAAYEQIYDGVLPADRPHTWIPILTVCTSVWVCFAGLYFVPWWMGGEIFPLQVRGSMGGAAYFVGSVAMFIFLKFHFVILDGFRVTGTLVFYAVASILTGLFGIFVLTETHNKTLDEIEASYQKKKKPAETDVEKTGL